MGAFLRRAGRRVWLYRRAGALVAVLFAGFALALPRPEGAGTLAYSLAVALTGLAIGALQMVLGAVWRILGAAFLGAVVGLAVVYLPVRLASGLEAFPAWSGAVLFLLLVGLLSTRSSGFRMAASARLDHPPEVVFDALLLRPAAQTWRPSVRRIEATDDPATVAYVCAGPVPGSERRIRVRTLGETRPSRIETAVAPGPDGARPYAAEAVYTMEPAGTGSRVRFEESGLGLRRAFVLLNWALDLPGFMLDRLDAHLRRERRTGRRQTGDVEAGE